MTGSLKYNPDIWDNRVVWADMRNGDFDIFLYTIGTSMQPLDADFTSNLTQGASPLVVAFTDATQGRVDGYSWDFGDGNFSREKNPVHTFDSCGSYTVVLTVHNPWQRDAERKTDLVSVGSEPVPGFSLNQTGGPAPLAIWFTDKSSGIPTEWHWDFGDGGESDEKDPVHIYTIPGVYSVNLAVSNIFGNASVMRNALVTVMDGTYEVCILPSEGINVTSDGNITRIFLNTSEAGNCTYDPSANQTMVRWVPYGDSGIAEIQFLAENGSRFISEGNDTITGTLGCVTVKSAYLQPCNFTQKVGENCFYHFIVNMDTYVPGGSIRSVAWEGCNPEDRNRFDEIKTWYDYSNIDDLAFTVRFENETFGKTGPATLVFGVSSDWVREYGWGDNRTLDIRSVPEGARVYIDTVYYGITPINVTSLDPGLHNVTLFQGSYQPKTFTMVVADERDSIHVIRIGEDGSGEVLNTTFIGHDPVRNLDFFRAESPKGLSTFGLASLSKSGSIFQILYLVLQDIFVGGHGGGGDGVTNVAQPAATPTPVPSKIPTKVPTAHPTMTFTTGPAVDDPGTTPIPTDTPPTPPGNGTGPKSPVPPVLKDLAVIGVVIIVTAVFYFRWKRREE
jgi:beta propeller repeat protein